MNAYVVTAARPTGFGALAFGLLLGAYFALLTVVSGWKFTLSQFSEFWFYILPLAGGFGLQVALYTRLRQLVHNSGESRKVMAASGTTSTVAMISCCAHYVTNILPVLGAAGLVALVAQYQVELFWFGLACNLAGIAYMGNRVAKFSRAHAMK